MKISIVIPTLNEEKKIADTLGLLRKRFPGAEIIVADGLSSDHTQQIARKIADKVVCEVHKGGKPKSIGAGRNVGARHAKGDVILFNDADTHPQPHYYAEMKKAFENPCVVGVGCKIMPDEATPLQRFVFELLNLMVWMSVKIGRPAIAGNSVAYRKDAFFKIGGFDEEMQASEDQDLCVRISKRGKVVYLNHVIAFTDSRRLKKFGLIGLLFDWGRTTFNFITGQKNRRYAIVREI